MTHIARRERSMRLDSDGARRAPSMTLAPQSLTPAYGRGSCVPVRSRARKGGVRGRGTAAYAGSMRVLGAALAVSMCVFAAKPVAKAKKPPLTAEQRAAQAMMKSMTLHDRVAQLVIGVAYGDVPSRKSPEYEKYRHWVHDLHIGGLIINNHVVGGLVRNAEPHALAL